MLCGRLARDGARRSDEGGLNSISSSSEEISIQGGEGTRGSLDVTRLGGEGTLKTSSLSTEADEDVEAADGGGVGRAIGIGGGRFRLMRQGSSPRLYTGEGERLARFGSVFALSGGRSLRLGVEAGGD